MKIGMIALLLFGLLVGCQAPEPTLSQMEQGIVYMIPGIEGVNWLTRSSGKALADGGIESAIYLYEWRIPMGLLVNLVNYQGNLEEAEELARSILEYQEQYPGRPVDIVSYSGGCGLTLMVLEALPADCRVRNVIMVHAAVDPKYDLREALGHVEGKLVNFYSPWDWLLLGLGTSVFGTIDRQHTFSAGNKGFTLESLDSSLEDTPKLRLAVPPKDLSVGMAGMARPTEELRGKVIQHQWEWGMFGTGHYGGHFPMGSYAWTKEYVAPYLVKERRGGKVKG
ncbi:MAG: hypothetical protein GY869_18375 [Planctomycetes bacterium]|nr:hypothetical protein [Planctomycetota bacterium]